MSNEEFNEYFKQVKSCLDEGTEMTPRTHLENLLNATKTETRIKVIQEPKLVKETSRRPDFKIKFNDLVIGYAETKPIGVQLDSIIDKETDSRDAVQLRDLLKIGSNVLLTNYNEFLLFKDQKLARRAALFNVKDRKLESEAIENVSKILNSFFTTKPEIVKSPEELSLLLATRTGLFRDFLSEELRNENKNEYKSRLIEEDGLYDLFRHTLIEDITIEEFVDAYVQTITYGLFIAKLNSSSTVLNRDNALNFIPDSARLIKELFETIRIRAIPDSLAWIIEETMDILNSVDLEQVKAKLSFSTTYSYEDPFVYFYENFLGKYDPVKKKSKGVYYTPIPIVRFIIDSINQILKSDFGLLGLRDSNVTVLDFATGTGTFLLEAFDSVKKETDSGIMDSLISDHLLRNFYGLEYLIAPYTIAHLKLLTYLEEIGYRLKQGERLQVYLADTLDDSEHETQKLFPAVSEEGRIAYDVKLNKRIIVVMGNPPYNVKSRNNKRWILKLLEDYKEGLHEINIQPLNDDYVKFIRYAQWKIEKNGKGIVGMISNNSYLDGLIHRTMRKKLYETFDRIYILNLHGHSRRDPDENVFDIRMGTAIALLVKMPSPQTKKFYYFSSLENGINTREEKYEFLLKSSVSSVKWQRLQVQEPDYWFIKKDMRFSNEYNEGWKLTDIFDMNVSGIKTARDSFFVDFEKEKLSGRIHDALTNTSDREVSEKYGLKTTSGWSFEKFRSCVFDESYILRYSYRPFDDRWLYYDPKALSRPRADMMDNFLKLADNIGLICVRQFAENELFNHVFVTNKIADIRMTISAQGSDYIFPLFLASEQESKISEQKKQEKLSTSRTIETDKDSPDPYSLMKPRPNFRKEFASFITTTYSFVPEPIDILGYIYAVLYSTKFRVKYNDFLKIDFPRIRFTSKPGLFKELSKLGKDLIRHHLLQMDYNTIIGNYPISGNNIVEKKRIDFDHKSNRLYINSSQYFENVSKRIWEFKIGGYQVIKEWLGYRSGHKLSYEELTGLRRIMNALEATANIMEEIDKRISDI